MSIGKDAQCARGARVRLFSAAAGLVLSLVACTRAGSVTFETSGKSLTIHRPALYPETIEYDRKRDKFLVSSFREGAVYEVDRQGQASIVVKDERLCSVLGIAVDADRGRLWAVIYDLSTGKALNYVDLAPLASGPHLLNGIALDSDGNAYVTDSFTPAIYKIDSHGTAAVFLSDAQFAGEGINLNGLVVHPDGYLLVIKKSDGVLFKVPLANPSRFTKVAVGDTFVGGDGLVLAGGTSLVVIANQVPGRASNAAFALSSDDGWVTAKVRSVQQLGDVYPTTAVLRDGKLYVIQSKLNELIQSPAAQKDALRVEATIREIGQVTL
jgi:hypothetical protein